MAAHRGRDCTGTSEILETDSLFVKNIVDILSCRLLPFRSSTGGRMRWWESSIGGPARGRIIGLLRRESRRVEELAASLRVTDNAVRAHLQALERAGLVRSAGVRRTGNAGKPATLYEIVPEAEPLFSSAYA